MRTYIFINRDDIKEARKQHKDAEISFTLSIHSMSLSKFVEKYELDNYVIKKVA